MRCSTLNHLAEPLIPQCSDISDNRGGKTPKQRHHGLVIENCPMPAGVQAPRHAGKKAYTPFVSHELGHWRASLGRSQKEFVLLTPGACLIALRIVLVAAAAATAVTLLGWIGLPAGVEGAAARAAILYSMTLLAFAALPRMRRDDIAGVAAALAAGAEAFHALSLHQVSPLFLGADVIGVFAAWAPAAVEQYRRLAREARYVAFRDLAVADRRRGAVVQGRAVAPVR